MSIYIFISFLTDNFIEVSTTALPKTTFDPCFSKMITERRSYLSRCHIHFLVLVASVWRNYTNVLGKLHFPKTLSPCSITTLICSETLFFILYSLRSWILDTEFNGSFLDSICIGAIEGWRIHVKCTRQTVYRRWMTLCDLFERIGIFICNHVRTVSYLSFVKYVLGKHVSWKVYFWISFCFELDSYNIIRREKHSTGR